MDPAFAIVLQRLANEPELCYGPVFIDEPGSRARVWKRCLHSRLVHTNWRLLSQGTPSFGATDLQAAWADEALYQDVVLNKTDNAAFGA